MNITINAVKFRLSEELEQFINDKVSKLGRLAPDAIGAEITLKVEPSADINKTADIRLIVRGYDLFASKQGSSFEESVVECIDAIKVQIEKYKEKQ